MEKAIARPIPRQVIAELANIFKSCGFVRYQNPNRRSSEGYMQYKKGDEIRFIVRTQTELSAVKRLLATAGFKPGRPFAVWKQYRLPLYGRDTVERFFKLIGESAQRPDA